jgi:hypothetical protein
VGCFFKFNGFKRLVLSSVLCAFPLAVVTPPPVYGQINVGFNDVNFGIKVQKLIDKAWKYYDKLDSNGLFDVILEIKSEVETYTGKKIDINKEIDKIESDLKKKGSKPPKGIFKKFKSLVHSKEKKKYHRAMCMESYFIDQPAMTFQDYEFMHLTATQRKQDQGNEQKELPLKFVVGVSLILGGAFVMFATPVCPVLGYAGEIMMSTGFGMMLDQGLDIYQKEY